MSKAEERVYKYWTAEIQRTKQKLELKERSSHWRENQEYLTGGLIQRGKTGKVGAVPNELVIACRELRIGVYPNDPHPGAVVFRPEDEALVDVIENLIYQELQLKNVRSVAGQITQDNQIAGIGFFKVAHKASLEKSTEAPGSEQQAAAQLPLATAENTLLYVGQAMPPQPTDLHQVHLAIHRKAQGGLEVTNPAYATFDVHCMMHELNSRPLNMDGIVVSRVSPKAFIYDPESTEWDNRLWEAEMTIESIRDLKADPYLKYTKQLSSTVSSREIRIDEESPNATHGSPENLSDEGQNDQDDPSEQHKYVTIWRIHDIENNKLVVLTEDHPQQVPLLIDDWPYEGIETYIPLVFNDIVDHIEGISDIDLAKPLQEELNEILARRREHVAKFSKRKLIMEKGAWDATAISQFRNPDTFEVRVPPGAVAKTLIFDPVPFPQDAYAYEADLRQHIRRTLGVYEKTAVSGADTATEAGIMDRYQTENKDERRERMAVAIEQVALSILKLHKKFSSTDLIVRLTGVEGVVWDRIAPDNIPDALHLTIDVDAWSSANPELRKRQWGETLPLLLQAPFANQREIILKTMEVQGIKNPEKYLVNIEQAMAQQMLMGGKGIGSPPAPQGPAGGSQIGQMAGNASGPRQQAIPSGMGGMV